MSDTNKMNKEFKHLIDYKIEDGLTHFGGLIIRGPRFVGKTTLAMKYAKTVFDLSTNQGRILLNLSVNNMFQNDPKPILVDEWQMHPSIFLEAKSFIDCSQKKGVVIFTGSVWLGYRNVGDPGIGRFKTIDLRPLTLDESEDSERMISLQQLAKDGLFPLTPLKIKPSLEHLIGLVCRGGFPLQASQNVAEAQILNREQMWQTFDFIIGADSKVAAVEGRISRTTLQNIAKYLALKTGQVLNFSRALTEFMEAYPQVSRKTFERYFSILQDLFLVETLPIHGTNLASKKRILVKPKFYWIDPSLPIALLGWSPVMLKNNLNSFGFLFENLVYRELRSYVDYYEFGAQLGYYRDSNGFEVDFILEWPDGYWVAIEVKLGDDWEMLKATAKRLIRYKQWCQEAELETNPNWNMHREWVPRRLIIISGMINTPNIIRDLNPNTGLFEEVYVIPLLGMMP